MSETLKPCRLTKALAEVKAELATAQTLMHESGFWKNPAGKITDAALWVDRAWNTATEALEDHPHVAQTDSLTGDEPVAWRLDGEGGVGFTAVESYAQGVLDEGLYKVTPLYARSVSVDGGGDE